MTECAALCDGYLFMGLQFTNECFCGNTYGSQSEAAATDCDSDGIVAVGDMADLCGDGGNSCGNRNAIYTVAEVMGGGGGGSAGRCGTPTAWTVLPHDGPTHHDLQRNALHGHQMALITSDCVRRCGNFAEFSAMLPAMNAVCCPGNTCPTGLPTTCSAACAAELVPLYAACSTFLSDNAATTGDVQTALRAAVATCRAPKPPPPPPAIMSLVDTLAAQPDTFSTLLAAAIAAGLAPTLNGDGPFTVFAPTNAAFAALGQSTVDSLLANPAQLADILTYHVVAGHVLSTQLSDGMVVPTVEGASITVAVDRSGVTLNGVAHVIAADIECDTAFP